MKKLLVLASLMAVVSLSAQEKKAYEKSKTPAKVENKQIEKVSAKKEVSKKPVVVDKKTAAKTAADVKK